jgi:hemolysin activation/secretion protein
MMALCDVGVAELMKRRQLRLFIIGISTALPALGIDPAIAVSSDSFAKGFSSLADATSDIEVIAQINESGPNRDRFLQPQPIPQPSPIPPSPLSPPAPSVAPPLPTDQTPIPVRQIQVVGSTVFRPEDFSRITGPFEGRTLTLAELANVADQITQLYLDGGYLTSRAIIADQPVTDGVVQIRVIEGSLEQIEIEGNSRVRPGYIRNRISLGTATPLNQGRLEDQLRLLRVDPLFENVEASLRAGTGLGQSILTVRVTEAKPYNLRASADNFSPPSVGSERLGIGFNYRNLTGLGDEIFGSYFRTTTGGSNLYDLSYRIPLNPMNGTLELRIAPSDFQITDPQFAGLDISGSSRLYEGSFRQPLLRSPREEFALSLGFTYRTGETLINQVQVDSSTTSVLKFGQDYVRRDPQGAWSARSLFSIGTGLFDATIRGNPDGVFVSWLGQLQRVQIINPRNLLILQADLQLTPDALLASQQFVIGGGQSVRGFRQNMRLGDNGVRLSAEDRIAILLDASGNPSLQVAPFADLGAVWNNSNNPNPQPNQRFLLGVGVGVIWQPSPPLSIRVDLALPLVDLSDRGENAQDSGVYFNVNYQI